MANPIRIRAKNKDGLTEVLILMPHPMETGLRKDDAGVSIPAHYITEIHVHTGSREVLKARVSIAVSRDPLLLFRFQGGQIGDTMTVSWTDNRGDKRSDQTAIT